MKHLRVASLAQLLCALFVALIPVAIFPVCGMVGFASLPDALFSRHGCHHTLAAALALAGLLVAAHLAFQVSPTPGRLRAVSIATALGGLGIILFPSVVFGMCQFDAMPCVIGTKPGLLVGGAALIGVSALGWRLGNKT